VITWHGRGVCGLIFAKRGAVQVHYGLRIVLSLARDTEQTFIVCKICMFLKESGRIVSEFSIRKACTQREASKALE
jgi:hypothetical protein